jgi:hypothetical protein
MMIWRHPGYDSAIVVTDALSADSGLLLLALSAFGGCVFAMTPATFVAHLERIILRKILSASFNRASTKRRC